MSALLQMADCLTGKTDHYRHFAEVVNPAITVRRYVYEEPADDPEDAGQELVQVRTEVVLEALEREIFALGSARIIASEIGVCSSDIRRIRNREKSPSERLANRLGFEVRRDVLTRTKLRRMTYWIPVVECPDKPRAHARFSRDES